jgi:mono/diheme cytochrome c family protein
MSTPSQPDPRVDSAAITDENLLAAHEKLLGRQPDEKGRYRLLPLNMLFILSALIMFSGTYLGRYAGHFDPRVYNENSGPPKEGAAEKGPVDMVAVGRATYVQVCQACHQATGQGLPPVFPPLVGSEWVVGSEERLIRVVLHGLKGPIKVNGVDFTGEMPATGPGSGFNLNPEKVAAVITFIRQEWGNAAGPVTTEKVAEVRGKEGNRGAWTAEELAKLP